MKKLVVAVALLSLFSIPAAFAQDEAPAFEVFGGYSLIYDNDMEETDHGFTAAVEGNVTDMFGVVGDFGFYDGDGYKIYTFMGGPRVNFRMDKFKPFVHLLLGGVNYNEDNTDFSDTNFSIAYGGGLDIVVNDLISIRPAQFEGVSVNGDSEWDTVMRYSAGVVLKF